MSKNQTPSADLRGLSKITIDAVVGVTEMVEAVHINILNNVAGLGVQAHKPLSGAAAMVYRGIRGVAQLVGSGIDTLLDRFASMLGKNSAWPGREAVLAALNGVLGDYLEATHNPLSITMALRSGGQVLVPKKQVPETTMPNLNGRILVLAHGLCMNDREWRRRDHDHGDALSRDRDYTPVYLHYNSGLHISANGRAFADQMEALLQHWPVEVEELAILGHSMGGLVARSAFHYAVVAGHRWPRQLRKLVFMGTPHHGAPLERGGNWFHVFTGISSYTAPFSNLGKIRSSGITDLRYGNLLDADWEGQDRFAHLADQRGAVPLPPQVQCYAIAATTGKQAGDISDRLLGDGLVPLDSALGRHENPALNLDFAPENQWIGYGMNHLDLLNRKEVYQRLLDWL